MKKIIIIGGGLAGLAAGCYGQMNGYRTSILEMHDKTGGLCTAWKRKGYTIDAAMNWLAGTSPKNSYYRIWEELGVAQDWKIVNHEYYLHTELENGKVFTIYSDMDRLKAHMMELGPEDKMTIEELIKAMRTMSKINMPIDKAPELYNMIDGMKMVRLLPYMGFMRKWMKISTAGFTNRFKNPILREAFSIALSDAFGVDLNRIPMFFTLGLFAFLHHKIAGYLIGGSRALSGTIEQRYLNLGGELHLKSRAEKILVENNKAIGVRLADGTEYRGDHIISAADGRTTIFDMLDGKYIDDDIRSYYDKPQLFPPLVFVGLGVARKFDDILSSVEGISLAIDEPIIVAGKEQKRLGVQIYNFDPTLAPEGKTVVRVLFATDYDYWEELGKEPVRYKAEKEKITDQVVERLDKRFPGLAEKVEMRDVATPLTWVRYTGNWRGSYQGWALENWSLNTRMSKRLPGLDSFYMAGQWVEPGGGMPTAAVSGRNVIQIICKKDKGPFITNKP